MNAVRTAALTAAILLVGCPIPQPLPGSSPGEPKTPPRVIVDDTVRQVSPPDPIVRVPSGCATAPTFQMQAWIRNVDTAETVVARWFVDYDLARQPSVVPQQEDEIAAPANTSSDPTLRQVPTFRFPPYQYASPLGTGGGNGAVAGAVHVVELVVSNGFDPSSDAVTATLPYRKPSLGFEVQLYRWVFVTVPPSDPSCTGDGCVLCPTAAP
jgi:hypothetical protein